MKGKRKYIIEVVGYKNARLALSYLRRKGVENPRVFIVFTIDEHRKIRHILKFKPRDKIIVL